MSDPRNPSGRNPSSTDTPAQDPNAPLELDRPPRASNPGVPARPSSPGMPAVGGPARPSNPGMPAAGGPARPSNPGMPAAGQPRPSNPAMKAAGTARTTNPGGMKVITATRTDAPPPEPEKKLQDKLKDGATDAALNVVGILKDTYGDFRRSDRFFKYKAGIIASWVAITCLTLVLSCPPSELDAKNRLGARLGPRPADPTRPAVTIFNDSDKRWTDVRIIVNEKYQASMPSVEARDAVTVTPRQLLGPGGKVAPLDLRATDVELRTSDGKARLMKEGQEQ